MMCCNNCLVIGGPCPVQGCDGVAGHSGDHYHPLREGVDDAMLEGIRKGVAAMKRGEVKKWPDVARELGMEP